RIGQHRMRFEQPLTLDVSGYTSGIFEQPIKIGSGHSNQPVEDRRPKSRCPQVLPNHPPHPLIASHVDCAPATATRSADGAAAAATIAPTARASLGKSTSVTCGRWCSRASI